MKTSKTIIHLGLALLAVCSVVMLFDTTLSTYQQCFLVGTMSISTLIALGINN